MNQNIKKRTKTLKAKINVSIHQYPKASADHEMRKDLKSIKTMNEMPINTQMYLTA